MKAKLHYSDLNDRKYIGTTLALFGMFAAGAALNIAWPTLSQIGSRLIG